MQQCVVLGAESTIVGTEFPTVCKATVLGTVHAVVHMIKAWAIPFTAKETAAVVSFFFDSGRDEVSDMMELQRGLQE